MRFWLLKSEPDVFGFADLVRVGREPWNGVRDYQARNFLRELRPGDVVAGMLPRRLELVALILGTWRLGAVYREIPAITDPAQRDCGIARPLELTEILPGIALETDPALLRQKSRDFFWFSPILNRVFRNSRAEVLARPRDEAEVVAIAAACARQRVPLTARGAVLAVLLSNEDQTGAEPLQGRVPLAAIATTGELP